jgi:hypothetical protein
MTSRNNELQEIIDKFDNYFLGITIQEAHENEICIDCKQPITTFKDELSKKEYEISGWCQRCQDEIFNGENL